MNGGFLTDVIEKWQAKSKTLASVKEPRKYKVVLVNDDYTPMDFVVSVLVKFFCFSQQDAFNVMLQVHYQGRGLCGVFSREIAETKVALVNSYAQSHEHPLMCLLEPE